VEDHHLLNQVELAAEETVEALVVELQETLTQVAAAVELALAQDKIQQVEVEAVV
jgi:hypothetical protein